MDLGYEGKSGMVSTTKSRKVSSGRPRLLVKSSVPVGLDKIRVILSNGRRILLFKKDLVKQKVVKQIPGIMESFVLWPVNSVDIQSNGKLGCVWIGSQFFEDKKIKSVPYGKSLVLHTKALRIYRIKWRLIWHSRLKMKFMPRTWKQCFVLIFMKTVWKLVKRRSLKYVVVTGNWRFRLGIIWWRRM